MLSSAPPAFEWRAATGRWRWLLLGTLGVATGGCWGEVQEEENGTKPGTAGTGTGTSSAASTSASNPATSASPTPPLTTTTTSTSPPSSPSLPVTPPRAPGSECSNPTPFGGGWERCDNGLIHRAQVAGECASQLPRDERISEALLRAAYPSYDPSATVLPPEIACVRDSDCTAKPFGHCEVGGYDGGVYCDYGCATDADCSAGTVCVCGEPAGRCVASTCRTDADCPDGLCADYVSSPGCSSQALACQTLADQCVTSADCGGLTCTVEEYSDGPKYRKCTPETWVCGRPFLIDGDARRAASAARDDWYPAAAQPGLSAAPIADPELRARVAQGWLDQALIEHASVAAFARFSLQLLQLGAPAELVSDASQALADEVAHARDCFLIARRYSDCDRGPAPLSLTGELLEPELNAIVLATILEGCIGETVAALEAAEALAHCEDAAARAVLERISADETRHAQLAWRFVAWALERGPASLRPEVEAAFERELASAPAPQEAVLLGASEHELLRHGLVGPELRRALRARVLHEVVAPCARTLLTGPARPLVERPRDAAGA